MASKKEVMIRSGMALLAVLFLITSVGFSILVIWQGKHKQDQEKVQTAATKTQEANMLQGTTMQNFTPIAKIDSLTATDLVPGTGEEVKTGATVTAHYTGATAADGKIFQSSHDTGQPVEFPLDRVIAGWTQGVPGMKVGGTRRLLIPAALAYGTTPPQGSGIAPNSDLVFDIELVSVKQ